jgi:hypothetical protein
VPIFIDVRAPSIYTNATAGTFTNDSTETFPNITGDVAPVLSTVMVDLPLWASREQQKAHRRLSRDILRLSAAHQARLRKR